MISFRLTDEEYKRFQRVCMSRGVPSISELVRGAVNQFVGEALIDHAPAEAKIQVRVAELECRLEELVSVVAEMGSRLTSKHATSLNSVHFVQTVTGQ